MRFVERLREEEGIKQQLLRGRQETQERERVQREAAEREYRSRRRKQAEEFHQESAVGMEVNELREFLGTPSIPYEAIYYTRDRLPLFSTFNQRDQDSVLDTVHWDHNIPRDYGYIKCSYRYLTVETCSDGTLVFHGGFLGSTTLRLTEWRIKGKEQLFDRALEKAFKNPIKHNYFSYRSESPGCG